MENTNQNNGKTKDLVKKYLPISALILLTFLLMIFFRYKKGDIGRILEKGKENLIAFYSANLQPLFATTDISNEDVFNFALYQSLPIDKQKNKVLTVTNEDNNNQVYEVKPALYNPQTSNYEKFVDYLGLNTKEKEEADSILNLYKKEIYLSVLTNNKNTVAVNPKIGELQKAVLADLLTFAHKVNAKKAWQLFPAHTQLSNEVRDFVHSAKSIPQNEFLFITPDTAFQTVCSVDTKDLEDQLNEKLKTDEVATPAVPPQPSTPKNWNYDFHFRDDKTREKRTDTRYTGSFVQLHKPDSNFFKVVIPIPEVVVAPNVGDSVRVKLNQAAEKIRKLSIVFGNKSKSDRRAEARGSEKGDIELYFQDPTEIVGKTMEMLSKQNFKDWDDFGKKMDSFARSFAAGYADSVLKNNKEVLEKYQTGKKHKVKTPKAPKDTVNN